MPRVEITLKDGNKKIVEFENGFTDADVDEVARQLNSKISGKQTTINRDNISPINALGQLAGDLGKGFAQGYSSLGVGIGKNIVNPYVRPLLGKKPLTDAELDKAYGFLDDKPKNKAQGAGRFVGETVPYLILPEAKVIKAGAKAPAATKTAVNLANKAITGTYQGGVVGGVESVKNKGITKDLPKDIAGGVVMGGTLTPTVAATPMVIKAGIDKSKPLVNKTISALTSVPEDVVDYALTKELEGNTIFNTIGNKRVPENIPLEYNKLGQRALNGIEEAEKQANAKIAQSFGTFGNEPIDISALKTSIRNIIDNSAGGSEVNYALRQTGVSPTLAELAEDIGLYSDKQVKPMTLHKLKSEGLDKKLAREYGQNSGDGVNMLKKIRHEIDNTLDNLYPEYNTANAARADIYNVKNLAKQGGGLNPQTLAGKLENFEAPSAYKRGFNESISAIDEMVPDEYKFLDDVRKLNAQNQFNKWVPGQGGGSGSGQGFANLLRTGVIGGAPTASFITGNPTALAALGAISPKIMGEGTIKNVGRLYNLISKPIPNAVLRPLPAGSYNFINPDEIMYNSINQDSY